MAVDARPRLLSYCWPTYIALCLLAWVVLVAQPGTWALAVAHWPMALVMVGGSMVAGSTPMSGGTVAFPVLVLGFGYTPSMARDFGLAIQSVGLTSALLFIVGRGIPVERRLLLWSTAGAVAGLVLGTFVLVGRVQADWVKLLFATMWATFGLWMVSRTTAGVAAEPREPLDAAQVPVIGLLAGLVGGAMAALIGVGVEMVVYATLVLRFGWGPRAAVPTAVCAMALASPIGLLLRATTSGIDPGVFPEWIAAAPVVIFGAPAGAYLATRMSRVVLLRTIGILVLVQFAATINQVRPTPMVWAGVLALAACSGVGLWLLAPSERSSSAA